ncbi:hypothetical protein ACGE24_08900 [Corynebacterium kroppenstedtii]|uniref:hypothetical protein n=1 Tax=Corynebacterium sp. PCR 32 TaxID=3351342 RepID=UPI00309D0E59
MGVIRMIAKQLWLALWAFITIAGGIPALLHSDVPSVQFFIPLVAFTVFAVSLYYCEIHLIGKPFIDFLDASFPWLALSYFITAVSTYQWLKIFGAVLWIVLIVAVFLKNTRFREWLKTKDI